MTSPSWLKGGTNEEPGHAAVGVEAPDASHIGVLYRDADGVLRWLHLEAPHNMEHETPPRGIAWVESPIEPERLALVAAMCERVLARNGQQLPFGLRFDAARFADDGTPVFGPSEHGFTCATFVLAVYRSVGLDLIRYIEWPARSEDIAAQEALIELLEVSEGDKQHLAAVKKELGSVRFRPAEVAGATSVPPPCGFDAAVAAASELMRAFASGAGSATE